jgi:hypothetical protein
MEGSGIPDGEQAGRKGQLVAVSVRGKGGNRRQ